MKKKFVVASLCAMVALFGVSVKNNSVNAIVKSNVEALVSGENNNDEANIVTLDIYEKGYVGAADKVTEWDIMGNQTWCGDYGQHTQSIIGSCVAIVFNR